MNCSRCGNPIPDGAGRCPVCGSSVRYGGNTEFFGKAVSSNVRLSGVFSDVFKKHPKSDGERLFMAGTQQSTPREDEMLREWRKPWVFAWVALVGLLVSVILYFMSAYTAFSYPGFMAVGSFVMPVATLMFYWEMNIPRNIPLYGVLLMFLVGGAFSLLISIIFFQIIPMADEMAALAAFCEEPGKLLALAFFLRKPDKKYILNGILIGGAVGAGFAAMESLGYAFTYAAAGAAAGESGLGTAIVLMRGVLAPGGHVVWAAIYGGALALAKGREPLRASHFTNPVFLGCLGISMALHFTWNSGVSLVPLPVFGDLLYILLTIAAWAALFWVMNKGIRQVVEITNSYGNPQAYGYGQKQEAAMAAVGGWSGQPTVVGIRGVFAGQTLRCQAGMIVFGREPSLCNLVFPTDIEGISRKHCILQYGKGCFYLSDCNSTYGTYLGDGRRLKPGEQVPLSSGQQFYLGNEIFEVRY
ncbi:MAG: PrsW family intramembrane metalloprotease [Lachnospiraceae bacterium]|nr:PrsW family intramembrane metalloprotease [Lachnospiraceae bacterium]